MSSFKSGTPEEVVKRDSDGVTEPVQLPPVSHAKQGPLPVVVQATSHITAVTINEYQGFIQMFDLPNNTTLETFQVFNNKVKETSHGGPYGTAILVNLSNSTGGNHNHAVDATNIQDGSFFINIVNTDVGNGPTDGMVIYFELHGDVN